MLEDKRNEAERRAKSGEVERQLVKLQWPVLTGLNQKLDRCLVKTFLGLVMAIILHRHRNNGLLLSELGGYLLGAEHGRAGTKRKAEPGNSSSALSLTCRPLFSLPVPPTTLLLLFMRFGGCHVFVTPFCGIYPLLD